MTYLDGTKEQFQQFMAMPIEGSLKMLNLLKFKSQIDHSNKSGAEHYQNYLKAAQPFFAISGAKIIFYGNPQLMLIGPSELEWDKVLIVEYPNREAFLSMVMNKDYPSHIRKEALEDSRLIYCS